MDQEVLRRIIVRTKICKLRLPTAKISWEFQNPKLKIVLLFQPLCFLERKVPGKERNIQERNVQETKVKERKVKES